MRLSRLAPDITGMTPPAATATRPADLTAVRAHRGEDAVELQRRLEAFLLIARRISPEVRRSAA
jgi:hypothetical protein